MIRQQEGYPACKITCSTNTERFSSGTDGSEDLRRNWLTQVYQEKEVAAKIVMWIQYGVSYRITILEHNYLILTSTLVHLTNIYFCVKTGIQFNF